VSKEVSDLFSGTVELENISWLEHWKTDVKALLRRAQNRGRERRSNYFFGILCRNRAVWDEVVNDVEAGTLQGSLVDRLSLYPE